MPDVVEVNCQTGKIIERNFTPEEIAQREADAKTYQQMQKAQEAAESKRASALAKLQALGLTEADLHALGL